MKNCKKCLKLEKQINKITSFCCQLENEAYDRGFEDTIEPITNKILNIINRKEK